MMSWMPARRAIGDLARRGRRAVSGPDAALAAEAAGLICGLSARQTACLSHGARLERGQNSLSAVPDSKTMFVEATQIMVPGPAFTLAWPLRAPRTILIELPLTVMTELRKSALLE